ncbi:tail fiber protein, partial [Methylobacterium sp. WL6]|uniref:tail fiber protein n=1 Tax=Methylobacterium sp. WL6 TaxID=2603901 RepID=UPI0011CB0C3D
MTDTFDNRQASLALTQVIVTQGIYPTRPEGGIGGSDTTMASLRTFAFNYSPDAAGVADGHTLPINQNAALYSLIGTTYGGNGQTNFAVPDLAGRVVVGAGSSGGLTVNEGNATGTTTATLNTTQLPVSVGGGGQPFSNVQPSLPVYYGIQTSGDGSSTYTGEVDAFATSFVPDGYILADGHLLQISQYQTLFAAIGTRYGGDGTTTFAVPNLVGREIVGTGTDTSGASVALGQVVGNSSPTLTATQLPSTAAGGTNAVVDNRAASLGLNYAIAVQGIYPSRDGSAVPEGDPILGEIRAFAGAIPTTGWAAANGQTLAISSNTALYSLLGTNYGGNGTQNFQLPNLNNRVIVGTGTGAADGQGYVIGGNYGSNNLTLTTAEIPDTTLPVITLTAPAGTIEATTAQGASVTFSATASDNLDRFAPVVTFRESVNGTTKMVASGDTFATGTHSVVATATDVHGNTATRSFAFTVTDPTPPQAVSIVPGTVGPTNTTTLTETVTFSETVTGLDASDFTVTGTNGATATVSSVTATATPGIYTVGLTGVSGTGSLQLNLVNDGTIKDTAGNALTGTLTGPATAVDHAVPTITGIVPSTTGPTNATTLTETVTFSEAVTGVTADDFTVTSSGTATAQVASVSGSGTTYTVALNQATGDGTVRLDLKASGTGITDTAGNPITGGLTGPQTTLDHTAPTATSTAAVTAANAASETYAVHFSEAVTGVGTNDFVLASTGGAGGNITAVTGSGQDYTVTVSGISGAGSLALALADTPSVNDAATNALAANGLTSSTAHTIDRVAPNATAIAPSTASPTNATTLFETVTFSEAVTGVTADDFTVNTSGTATAQIASVSGSGTTYTVTLNQAAGDGTLRLDLKASGTGITDTAGNPIAVGLTGPQTTLDHTAPVATSTAAATAANAASETYAVHFSETVTGVGANDFVLAATGSAAGNITAVTGSGQDYSVTVSGISGAGSLALALASTSTINDAAGNALTATGLTSSTAHTVDRVAPNASAIVPSTTGPTNATTLTETVTFSEAVTGVTADDFTVNTSGTATAQIASVSGSGTTYTVTLNQAAG